jgi:transmembrane sensor
MKAKAAVRTLDPVTEAAIEWLVVMRSGTTTATEQQAFERWLRDNTAHRQAWQQLTGPVQSLFTQAHALNQRHPGQAEVINGTLLDSSRRQAQRRRVLRGALAVGGLSAGAALLADRCWPLQDMLAELRTGTGQRREFALADGSTLLLNARSAANLLHIPGLRGVTLQAGEAIAQVTAGDTSFAMCGPHGQIRVGAGVQARMLMRLDTTRSLAVALEQPLQLSTPQGAQQVLSPGEAAWFGPHGIDVAPHIASTAATWQRGQLEVHDRPLGEVVAALRTYRRGFIHITDTAAALQVYGSYSLDDTDHALAAIAQTLPVAVHRQAGGWLVRIALA